MQETWQRIIHNVPQHCSVIIISNYLVMLIYCTQENTFLILSENGDVRSFRPPIRLIFTVMAQFSYSTALEYQIDMELKQLKYKFNFQLLTLRQVYCHSSAANTCISYYNLYIFSIFTNYQDCVYIQWPFTTIRYFRLLLYHLVKVISSSI